MRLPVDIYVHDTFFVEGLQAWPPTTAHLILMILTVVLAVGIVVAFTRRDRKK